ncbi:thioredoxin family protein [Paraflavitalea sp. CAU 1676]|uniref:thioredoxin family protein n=1 Tax=Paraflavitalea sp. CAU 1676 TaxID=3032598 RepID=UPI0023DC957C|nr:thioredoxin family protein [Paraflavitalea sp. CAU 1676]MDF2191980.1 thioredoxin family protein [Paraflavitalea sp. CAU 1676]
MKKLVTCLVLPVIALLAFTVHTDPLPIGAPLPKAENKIKDISGKELTLKGATRDNGLLVMFSCNTCPVVINNQSRTNEVCKYAQDKQVGVVLLNSNEGNRAGSESLEAMKKYGDGQGFNWYYAEDKNNELADAFGATRTPECFLFDKAGKLVYHGAIDDNPNNAEAVNRKHLKEAIDEVTAGKDVSVKQSRSIGCSIKRKS